MDELTAALCAMVRSATDKGPAGESFVDWRDVAMRCHIRLRMVRLRRNRWWLFDSGPLLAFRQEDGSPVVLTRLGWKGYRILEPHTGKEVALDWSAAAGLKEEAFVPYTNFAPTNPKARQHTIATDLDRLQQLGYGFLSALVGSSLIVTLWLVDHVFSIRDVAKLRGTEFVWVGLVGAFAVCELMGSMAGLRSRSKANLQAHVLTWNQVLRLPLTRFREGLSFDIAAQADSAIAAGDDASSGQHVLRLEIPRLFAGITLILITWPAAGTAALLVLLVLASTQYALTFAHQKSVRNESILTAQTMRKRSLLASHFPLLRSLGALQWALQRGHIATEEEAQSGVRSGRSRQNSEITQYVGFFIVTVTITAALAAGLGAHVSAGRLWVAFASFLWAGSTSCNVAGAFATIRAANERMAGPDSVMRAHDALQPQQRRELSRISVVAFENVGFAYARTPEVSLKPISFEIRAGECVVIAGASGSGKTTLIRLLTALEQPTQGIVLVNGIDLRFANIEDYRRRIGAVFQDESVEVMTVRRVILGMAPIPEERAWEVARMVGIGQTIAELPMGMQTMVTSANTPSALLNQLLIARALARDPEILVLDEALSNIDEAVQSSLLSNLRSAGMTIVICTHRPFTMALADRVIEVDGGRMAELSS